MSDRLEEECAGPKVEVTARGAGIVGGIDAEGDGEHPAPGGFEPGHMEAVRLATREPNGEPVDVGNAEARQDTEGVGGCAGIGAFVGEIERHPESDPAGSFDEFRSADLREFRRSEREDRPLRRQGAVETVAECIHGDRDPGVLSGDQLVEVRRRDRREKSTTGKVTVAERVRVIDAIGNEQAIGHRLLVSPDEGLSSEEDRIIHIRIDRQPRRELAGSSPA